VREQERQTIVEMMAHLMAMGLTPAEATAQLEPATGIHRPELRRLRGALEQGDPLPEAPSLLPPELPALVEAGQRSGELAAVMEQASRYLMTVHGAVRTALLPLFYPLLLLAALALVCSHLYRTQLAMGVTEVGALALFGSIPFLFAVVVGGATLAYWIWWRRRPRASNRITGVAERVLSIVPGLRRLVEQPALAVAAGSLAATLRAGVDGGEAVRIAAESCRSARLREGLLGASRALAVGAPLQRAMDRPEIPEQLRLAAGATDNDQPFSMEAVAQAALRRLETQAHRTAVVAFSVMLLLTATCVGLALLRAYGAIWAAPGGF